MTAVARPVAARSRRRPFVFPFACLLLWWPIAASAMMQEGAESVIQEVGEDDPAMTAESSSGEQSSAAELAAMSPGERTLAEARAALAAFDPKTQPAYRYESPEFVKYQPRRGGRILYGWLHGMSPHIFFVEPVGTKPIKKPPTGAYEPMEEEDLKGIANNENAWKFVTGKSDWDDLADQTARSYSYRKLIDAQSDLKDLQTRVQRAEEAVAAAATPDPEPTPVVAKPAPRAPSIPTPEAPSAPEQPVAVNEPAAVDQIKNLPSVWKWGIGIGAVLLILFFIRR